MLREAAYTAGNVDPYGVFRSSFASFVNVGGCAPLLLVPCRLQVPSRRSSSTTLFVVVDLIYDTQKAQVQESGAGAEAVDRILQFVAFTLWDDVKQAQEQEQEQ